MKPMLPDRLRIYQTKSVRVDNLFRDQMDRYGEICTTYDKILKGVLMHPDALVLANSVPYFQ